jgi:hypothetical protein
MKNKLFYFLFLIVVQIAFAQNNLQWKGYFSYNNIKDLSESPSTIFAASENALFSKKTATNEIKTTNTIDGLSGETISSLYYSKTLNKTLVGYESGLMIVINEADGSMIKVVDIISKQLPSGIKKINHFMEYNGIVYVSCDFGIVQFNLATAQFGDTYFIGDFGTETKVTQTTVYKGFIYAATNNGIRKASITNNNLIDYSQWTQIALGNWSSVEAFGTELIAINTSGSINKYSPISNTFSDYFQLSQTSVDMRAISNYLIVTTSSSVYIFDSQIGLLRKIDSSQISESTPIFTCATSIGDSIYIGTQTNGLINTTISISTVFENSTPSGPSRNNIFALQATTTSLWAVYGSYTSIYNPYPLQSYGVSKYNSSGWLNIPYEKVLGAKSITRITVNPNNENQVFASSFYSGLLKIDNDIPTVLYNQTNSSLEEITLIPGYHNDLRINGAVFDSFGNLWMNNSRVKNGLKELKKDGQWQSYSTETILNSSEDNSYNKMAIDKKGTKWIASYREGVLGFNESLNKFKKITVGTDAGNLPSADVRAIAVDNKDELWIGTSSGLRVLPSVSSFLTDTQLKTNSIIILDNNLAQELMYQQFITDIVVDGANNKWIGTLDSGIFLVSPNGQQTIYHFTAANSPLPSNSINDVDINNGTGEVFIATDKGLVSFKGTSTSANNDLNNVYVYPNPVRPEFTGTVKITGLIDKANVKITDIEGNLVYETTSQGGTIEWDTTAFGKYKVATGVYMIFVAAQDGVETKVKKVMIIR